MIQYLIELEKNGVEVDDTPEMKKKEAHKYKQLLSPENKERIRKKLENQHG